MEDIIQSCSTKEMYEIYLKDKNCQIIDVREEYEFDNVRIPNSKLIPLSRFTEEYKKIEKNKNAYLLCGIGKRARKAGEFLVENGFTNIVIIEGGIKSWIENKFPVESSN